MSKNKGNVPTVYTPDGLVRFAGSVQARTVDGRTFTPRPLGFYGLCLKQRIITAYKVFTGQYDALRWEEKS